MQAGGSPELGPPILVCLIWEQPFDVLETAKIEITDQRACQAFGWVR